MTMSMKTKKIKESHFEYLEDRIDYVCTDLEGKTTRYKDIKLVDYNLGGKKISGNESSLITITSYEE